MDVLVQSAKQRGIRAVRAPCEQELVLPQQAGQLCQALLQYCQHVALLWEPPQALYAGAKRGEGVLWLGAGSYERRQKCSTEGKP